jgi:hypothetical protein
MFFLILGFIQNESELQQWALILALVAFVFLLAERDARRGSILGPNQESEALRRIIRIISNSREYLKVQDAHPGERTLVALNMTPTGIPIQFLTSKHMSKENVRKFEKAARELMKTRPELEIRYAPPGSFHGRYLLTRPFGWNIDYSIKNAGEKDTHFSDLGVKDTKERVKKFDAIWEISTPLKSIE